MTTEEERVDLNYIEPCRDREAIDGTCVKSYVGTECGNRCLTAYPSPSGESET